jgi:hypothetical protein
LGYLSHSKGTRSVEPAAAAVVEHDDDNPTFISSGMKP